MSKHKPYRFLIYLLLELVRHFFLILPRPVGIRLGRFLGYLVYLILFQVRAKTIRHITEVFGHEKSSREIQRIARSVFIHLAESAVDVFRFPRLNRRIIGRLVKLDGGTETLDRALSRDKGVIVLTGHIGNWELLASYFRFLGYPGCLVGRKIYYEPYDRVLVSLRRGGLVSTLYRDESPRRILEELRNNHVVGMSADQDIDSLDGVFVSFFGRPAWTPIAPARLAWASGAAIVPAFMIHEQDHYRLFIEDPIWPDEGTPKEEAIRNMTERWCRIVERYVRLFPDQWVWMHNRWKTKGDSTRAMGDQLELEKVAG